MFHHQYHSPCYILYITQVKQLDNRKITPTQRHRATDESKSLDLLVIYAIPLVNPYALLGQRAYLRGRGRIDWLPGRSCPLLLRKT